MRPLARVWSVALVASLVPLASGCGKSRNNGALPVDVDMALSFAATPDMAGPAGPDLAQDAGSDDMGDPAGDDAWFDPCLERAKLIYTIDTDNTLRSFRPDTRKFAQIGVVNCPAEFGATPFSMSVDSDAVAWVLYSSGELFDVDTTNARCVASKWMPGQMGFNTFGMGFVADRPGALVEHLFVAGLENSQLGAIDPVNLTVAAIGPLNGTPELTGTASARLWAFFPDAMAPRVAELDKTTAVEGQTYPLNALAGTPLTWAFAFWGGDFWIFLERDVDNSTDVWHLDAQTGKVTDVVMNTGFSIVGAGVSICAPITAPH